MNRGKILLVEDDPNDEMLTIRALTKDRVLNEIIVARDGEEALDYLNLSDANKSEKERFFPELIILDLKLPKIDGLEVLKRIRSNERTKLLPVVILTSSNEEEDLINSYSLGANSYIQKPVDFDQFVEAAKQLQLYWLVLNEPPPQRDL